MKKIKEIKGITLIALVITIIVMLILVGVTLNVVLNNGLMENAQTARNRQEVEKDREQLYTIALGTIDKDGKVNYNLLQERANAMEFNGEGDTYKKNGRTFYVSNNGHVRIDGEKEYASDLTLGSGASLVEENDLTGDIKQAVEEGKVIAVIQEGNLIAPVPAGFTVSSTTGENTISGGLVIKDGAGNEFVWIPVPEKNMKVATLTDPYTDDLIYGSGHGGLYEPAELYDGNYDYLNDKQESLDYFYGTKDDGITPYYNYTTDFAYENHYVEMATSINKYGGFYIGRYETTIDNNRKIGSKKDTEILTPGHTLKDGRNPNIQREDDNKYYYRWWGLYYSQRHANISGNENIIQTNMISGQQWNKMLEYFSSNNIYFGQVDKYNNRIDYADLAGQYAYVDSDGNKKNDIIYNIYDLRGNLSDFTLGAYTNFLRTRVYSINSYYITSAGDMYYSEPDIWSTEKCSRLAFVIK